MAQADNAPLPDSQIWFVSAEERGVLAEDFVAQGFVSMGWCIGPLKPGESKPEIIRRLTDEFPDKKTGTIQIWASQIKKFNEEMAAGDAVATYNSQQRLCHIGIIRSILIPVGQIDLPREYKECHDYAHRVDWQHSVSRDDLSEHTRRRVPLPRTLYRLSAEASAELRGLCAR